MIKKIIPFYPQSGKKTTLLFRTSKTNLSFIFFNNCSTSSFFKICKFIFLGFFFASQLSAQISIQYTNPSNFSACGIAEFSVTIQNQFAGVAEEVEVTLQLPDDCGVSYLVGSVENAMELDTTNLGTPIFSLPDLSSNQSHTFSITLTASCEVVDCINSGMTFSNLIAVNTNLSGNAIPTNPYNIETPLLVITDISDFVLVGKKGDVVSRNITIQNTREGALSFFTFRDSHQGGIEIDFNVGEEVSTGQLISVLELDGDDFAQFGDGDMLFELDESITITENILITSCGTPETSTLSNLSVHWGCQDIICQNSELTALVNFETSDLRPELIFEPIINTPLCFCGTGYTQGMRIKNIGDEPATDILLTIKQMPEESMNTPENGIDPNSFVVDSNGVNTPFTILTIDPFTPQLPTCDLPDSLFHTTFARLPILSNGDSLAIFWEVHFCEQDCEQPFLEWEYDFNYLKSCPPNRSIQGNNIYVSQVGNTLSGALSTEDTILIDGENYTFQYEVTNAFLDNSAGVLTVDLFIPCGLTWGDNDLILGGQMPSGVQEEVQENGLQIIAEYDLPFPNNVATMDLEMSFACADLCLEEQTCQDSIVTSCPFDCIPPPPTLVNIGLTTSFNTCQPAINECGIQHCGGLQMPYDCPSQEVCLTFVDGYLLYDFQIERSNFGNPDNDNDRVADIGGTLDENLIRKDRAMTGDTLTSTFSGEIIADIEGASFKLGFLDIKFGGAFGLGLDNAEGLLNPEGLVPLEGTLRIVDASSNTVYFCDNVLPIPDTISLFSYNISPADLAAASCAIPSDFEYEDGDSIIFQAKHYIAYNLQKLSPADIFPMVGNITVEPAAFFYNNPDLNKSSIFTCGCGVHQIKISGYEHRIFSGIYALPPCEPSDFVGAMLIKMEVGDGNFFPFEHRPLMELTDFELQIPPYIELEEAQLAKFALQFSFGENQEIILKENQPLPFDFSNGGYHLDFSDCQNPALDEGFNFLLQYRFNSSECRLGFAESLDVISELEFASNLPETPNPLRDTLATNAIKSLIPNLFIEAELPDITSFDNKAIWDLDIHNFPTQVTSSMSGDAPNMWLYPTSQSGNLHSFILENTTTGEEIPAINGIFQLGNFPPSDTLPYRLIATNNSCSSETVFIRYGWNCEPYTNISTLPCYEKTYQLSVLSPPGEIEFNVQSPIGSNDLCDIVPYHTVEIFNAQLGAVYDVLLEAQLPPGLQIVSGSGQIAYPTGSDFVSIAEPNFLGDGFYVWNISNLNDTIANDGLASFNLAPLNSITLRFETATSCEFIAGAFIEFTARANQNCGLPTNFLSKTGNPIRINNTVAPYESIFSILPDSDISCQEEVLFNVNLTATGETGLRDSLFISLPPVIRYAPNSYTSVANMPNTEPVLITGAITQQLKWQLIESLPAGTPMQFSFSLTGFDEVNCGVEPIIFRTVAETEAICVINDENCSILIETGSLAYDAVIDRPIFDFSNFTITATPQGNTNNIDFSLALQNIGTVETTPPIVVDFHLDLNGNGLPDENSTPVFTASFDESIDANSSVNLSGNFDFNANDFCNLLAVIELEKNCACGTDIIAVQQPIAVNLPGIENICSGTSIEIGLPEISDHTYQWTPEENLSCTDCATATFNFNNQSGNPETFFYTLIDNDGACILRNQIEITVQPALGITTPNHTICEGQSTNLVAAEQGVSYLWQPSGFTEQIITVTPETTTTYFVNITDETGCVSTDSIRVTVSPFPIANAGDDVLFCGNEQAQLQAEIFPNYTYQWSPSDLLSNPSISNPLVLTEADTTFTLTVTDANGCQNTDEIAVSFGTIPNLQVFGDNTICSGDFSQLEAIGADNYQWTPDETLSCLDCPNPVATPDSTTTYTVTAFGENDCTISATFTVNVTDDAILTFENINTCENEPIDIFGIMTAEPGNYFDTTQLNSGCLEIHRITLTVFDTSSTFVDSVICEGDTLFWNGQPLTEAGEYCHILPTFDQCDSLICLNLEVLASPDFQTSGDVSIFSNEEANITINASGDYSYQWLPETGLSCTDCTELVATPDSTTTYLVTVINEENGCIDTASVTVTILIKCSPGEISVPNVFTPNGDSLNDEFKILTSEGGLGSEEVASMRIYNRWGQLVYEGAGDTGIWDGTVDGKLAPSDVYVYHIRVTCGEDEGLYVGDVTLIR